MSKVSKIAAGLAVLPMLAFAAPAFADSPGQLSNGATNYKVRNVTANGEYAQSISAACNDTVKYSVTVANSDFGMLTDVTVKANLASGAINASAKNVNGDTTSVSGSAKVTVPTNATLNYVAGSTVRINSENTVTTPESDGVTTANGVNVGTLNGSTYVRVQFQAKVNCPTPPKDIQVCNLTTKKVETIKEDQFDSTKYSKDLTKCQTPTTPPTVLANTGPGQVAGIVAATVVAATAGANFVLRRRAARQ
jgi:hypothetical protein